MALYFITIDNEVTRFPTLKNLDTSADMERIRHGQPWIGDSADVGLLIKYLLLMQPHLIVSICLSMLFLVHIVHFHHEVLAWNLLEG